MSDNPLSTNPILPADAHARYVPWLTDVDREIGCLVRVALQRDYSFLAAFHRGLSVPEAIREAIPRTAMNQRHRDPRQRPGELLLPEDVAVSPRAAPPHCCS